MQYAAEVCQGVSRMWKLLRTSWFLNHPTKNRNDNWKRKSENERKKI